MQPANVKTRITSGLVRVATGAAVAEVRRSPFRLSLLAGRKMLVREQTGGGLFYERAGVVHALGDVRDARPTADGAQLDVETDEGSLATVTLRFLTRRTLEVSLDPPDRGDRHRPRANAFARPRSERIYGLTERLRDSPVLAAGVLDVPRDDIDPPEVGSLDRRGETVEMRVLPTFSVYAPFYQSSLGYGLAVAGTTFGVFDLAKTDPATVRVPLRDRHRARRRSAWCSTLFAGPDYRDDPRRVHRRSPAVRSSRRDWAFLHWRWRDELRTSARPAMLDGAPVNAELADDVLMYDALGIPPGVYLFDRPVLAGEYGFGALGLGRGPAAEPRRDARSRSRGAATT